MPFGKLFSGSKSKNAGGQPDSATKKSSKKMHKKDQLLDLFDKCEQALIGPEMAASLLRENKDHCKKIGRSVTLRTRLSQLSRRFRMPIYDLIHPYVDDAAYLKEMILERFNVKMGSDGQAQFQTHLEEKDKKKESKWSLESLHHAYVNLSILPETHLARLRVMTAASSEGLASIAGGTAGEADSNLRSVKLEFNDVSSKTNSFKERVWRKVNGSGLYDSKDRMTGLNSFDTTFIHEIGHNVDNAMSNPTTYSSRPDFRNLDGIEWKEYNIHSNGWDLIQEMFAVYGYDALDASIYQAPVADVDRSRIFDTVRNVLFDLMSNPAAGFGTDRLKKRIGINRGSFDQENVKEQMAKALTKSKILSIIKYGHAGNEPYTKGVYGGGRRQFFQGYERKPWFSFNTAAFADKISRYQFREPCEDFAETYSLYYTAPQKLSSHRRMWFRSIVLKNPASRVKFHAMTGVDPVTGEKGPLDLTQQP